MASHLTPEQLEALLPSIRQAPLDGGALQMIVRRPHVDGREVLAEGELDLTVGLVGDTWLERGSSRTVDGAADPEAQLTIMNARVIDGLTSGDRASWPLAGDQLYVDLDISMENLPAGSLLEIGEAVVEISAKPHTGCAKFAGRFGADALRFVNTGDGKLGRFRGLNARVVVPGTIRVGDVATKRLAAEEAQAS